MSRELTIAAWKSPEMRVKLASRGDVSEQHPSGLVELDESTAAEIGGGTGWLCAVGTVLYATVQGTVCNGTCAVPTTYGCCNG